MSSNLFLCYNRSMHHKTIIDFKELKQRLIFTSPIVEIKTRDLSQVQSVLGQVENYQKQGYYVVGYLSYEASVAFESSFQVHDRFLSGEYLAYFTVHDKALSEDFPTSHNPVTMPDRWEELFSQEDYQAAIAHIHDNIRQGNTYQVNHTVRLKSHISEDTEAIYNRLMVEQAAGYNAYIAHDDFSVISASPELFFKKEGKTLRTRPMKGTIKRGLTRSDDLAKRDWLSVDPKNRAENMMIVDLLRNDMGRISEVGSVKVTHLCQVEQYSTVWQMTSTIESQLINDSLSQVFEALYPCGSITGAPKIATMAIIKILENHPRGVYCGAVGICLPYDTAIFNVPIRTIQSQGGQAYYGVGGGITWDSDWDNEYEEVLQKSAVLYRQNPSFQLISTGLVNNNVLELADYHLKRFKIASEYFSFPFNPDQWYKELSAVLTTLPSSRQRLSMSLDSAGQYVFSAQPLSDLPESFYEADLVERPEKATAFWTHKTSYRSHISQSDREQIFYNSQGILQETSIGNLILDIDGVWYTPKVSDGCLPGIYRQKLLDEEKVFEKHLNLEDLGKAQALYACNALRGVYALTIKKV